MNRLILVAIMALALVGCAQAVKDYQTGANTPLVNGEVSLSQKASVISNTVASLPIPFAAPIAMVIGFLGTALFTWQRGVSIRNSGGAPAANAASASVASNGVLQTIANVFTGMFTTASTTAPTATGSVIQRVWKVALATVASGVAVASTDPSFATYLTGHPVVDGIFVAVSAGVAGLEKALSSVPVASTPTPAAPVAAA